MSSATLVRTARASRQSAPRRPPANAILAAVTTCAGAFALMQAIVVPALPIIERDLHTTTAWATWTVSIYLLAASVATPLLGRLGDQFGKDRLLAVVMAIFLVGCVAATFSWDVWSLIVARAIQGAGGAAYPLAFSIIRDELPPERVGVGMGLVSSMLGAGGGIGLVLSGVIADNLSWRLLFVVGALVALIALLLVWRFVPRSPVRTASRPDLVGAALLSLGLVALLVALTEGPRWGWASPRLVLLAAVGVVLLGVWGWAERRIPSPMVDMRMLARRPVLFTNLTALATGFAMYVAFTLVPILAELPRGLPASVAHLADYGFGVPVTTAALFLVPGAVAMLPAGPLAGVLGRRRGARLPLVAGMVLIAVGYAATALWHSEAWQVMLAFVVLSVGVAAAFAAMPKLIADAVMPTETGIATGMNTVVRTVGGVIGAQIGATLLATQTVAGTGVPAASAFTSAFWIGAAAAAAGAVLALGVARRRPHLRPALEAA